MKKILLISVLCLGLAGCLGDADEATEKAKVLYDTVKQGCGVAVQLTDLIDVVTSSKYEGATATARFICQQVESGPTFGLFSKDEAKQCVAVVNDVCIRKEGD